MALGKCIISTKLNNVMPGVWKSGNQFLEANDENELENAISLLCKDSVLRNRLKNNAKAYFNEWLVPEVVVKRILDYALQVECVS